MLRPLVLVIIAALLASCERPGDVVPSDPAPTNGESPDAAAATEVFRLESASAEALDVTGLVTTSEARILLLDEIARRWPGRTVRADLPIDPDSPAQWVSEAVALLPYVAGVEDGGMVVHAEPGRAGGGVLTLTGRVDDADERTRIAADAAASVAPPFLVRTHFAVGPGVGAAGASDSTEARPAEVVAGAGLEAAAVALRGTLGAAAITFEPGTAELGPDPARVVDRIAAALNRDPGTRIVVAAPGEASGSGSLERALAARRAQALVDALVARGVDASRFSLPGADEEPPETVQFRLAARD